MYSEIEEHDGYTISRFRYEPTDRRLGRNVCHDSRSLAYQVQAKDVSTLRSVRHTRNIPVLNQGNIGSCTGNAATGALGSGVFWIEGTTVLHQTNEIADEDYAVGVYSEATALDPFPGVYPPTDTGSDGLSVAKVLQGRGLINGYVHATSLEAALTALSESPVIAGVEWRDGMFNPEADGRIMLTGNVAGGHEIVFDELDVENKRVWFTNSWGTNWGINGRAYLTWNDFGILLSRQGDVTQFVPLTVPAPVPDPPTPEPVPVNPDKSLIQEALDSARSLVASLEKLLESTP